jgi:Zn-dependent peptidase ImmA (M78 family)
LDIGEFRAFTLIDEYAPLIFLNTNDSDEAKLFSLLHEAVHIWLGVASFYNGSQKYAGRASDVETRCNAVAAEILVPNQIFKEKWAAYSYLPEKNVVKRLAMLFKCSITVIARRAKDNTYISSAQYKEITDEAITNYTQQKHEGWEDFYRTTACRLDPRFLLALDDSIKEEKTQYTDAYRLTDLNRTTFSYLVEQVRGSTQ